MRFISGVALALVMLWVPVDGAGQQDPPSSDAETYVCAFEGALDGSPLVETFVRDGDVFIGGDREFSVTENDKFLILTNTYVGDDGAVVFSRLIHKETAFPGASMVYYRHTLATDNTGDVPSRGTCRVMEGDRLGDVGNAADGPPSLVPPSPTPLTVTFPSANRSLRGQEIQVWVFVNEFGRVVADSTRLQSPTSDSDFNDLLVREAAQWIFEPARKGLQSVSSWFAYTITF